MLSLYGLTAFCACAGESNVGPDLTTGEPPIKVGAPDVALRSYESYRSLKTMSINPRRSCCSLPEYEKKEGTAKMMMSSYS